LLVINSGREGAINTTGADGGGRHAPEHSGSDLVLGLEIEFDLYVVGIAKENLPTGAPGGAVKPV
jgi:hypothetical protein